MEIRIVNKQNVRLHRTERSSLFWMLVVVVFRVYVECCMCSCSFNIFSFHFIVTYNSYGCVCTVYVCLVRHLYAVKSTGEWKCTLTAVKSELKYGPHSLCTAIIRILYYHRLEYAVLRNIQHAYMATKEI